MISNNIFRVFPNSPISPVVSKCKNSTIYLKNGNSYLDFTAGGTSHAILGWSHPVVVDAMKSQLDKFSHIDYKLWTDEKTHLLADKLTSMTTSNLDSVYFSGNSGSESNEAAIRMSYQTHCLSEKKSKIYYISREQSYHGMTADSLALSERPNLEFYQNSLSPYRIRIPMHHPLYLQRKHESDDEYSQRSAMELESEIIRLGPENVGGFLGETIMGGLIGNVPPAKNYWKYIRKICDKYDVH